MEKTKYIVTRLAIIAGSVVLLGAVMYGLGIAGRALGIEPEHIIAGLIGIIAVGMMVFWLAEDYELQKLKDKK
jgi:hypothetical protein